MAMEDNSKTKNNKKKQKDEMVNSDLHQEYVFQKPTLQNVKE